MKELADDNFKLNENGRKFFKRVKNAGGKKEKLLIMSNFSFSHSVFKRLVLQNGFLSFFPLFNNPEEEAFWKKCNKRMK